MGVDALDRKAHDVEIGAFDAGDTGVAYPFLDAVGPSLVEGLVLVYIVIDLFVREILEPDERGLGELIALCHASEHHAGRDLVLAAGKEAEHADGVIPVFRFPEDFSATENHCVCRNQDFIVIKRPVETERLSPSHGKGYLIMGQFRREVLDERGAGVDGEIKIQPREKFFSAWRIAGEYESSTFEVRHVKTFSYRGRRRSPSDLRPSSQRRLPPSRSLGLLDVR